MIPALLHDTLVAAARGIDPDFEVDPLVPTTLAAHGDYQWNFAFRLGKARKSNPRALADGLAKALSHPALARVEVAGPGFINLKLDDGWLAATLGAQVSTPAMGVIPEGAGRLAIVDFSSPNVAKRMHVGHMRSTHIGDALVRMHRAAGWRVIGDNHIGDWGTQFGKLIVAWNRWRDEAAWEVDAIGELERLYVLFAQKAEVAPELDDEARIETAKLQRGDPANTALWTTFLTASMVEFDRVYTRLGVRFDQAMGESAYRDGTAAVVRDLLDAGIAEPSEGAVVVRFGAGMQIEPGTGGTVLIIQKRDGASNYATTDLACVARRVATWAPDRMVYVTDLRQQQHFQQLFAIARRQGVTCELVHAWFGMLVLPEGAMSTRKGNVIRLVDLLDEAVARARRIVDEKSPALSDAERAEVAEAVGVGAIRHADLSQHPQTNITFEWDRMLAMDGNTAPYLLYSHARAASLLAKAGEPPDLAHLSLADPLERELALSLCRHPEAVAAGLRSYRPNLVADHLYDVANRFNRFYHELPVLTGGAARPARLALVEASRRVLRHGLELLGLKALERM
jgi:arginyl-tRNA synthetase